ncbi:tetraspanin-7 isoform X1 [Solea solea]|uniref:tetraspanin-7 isoform X1 n=1 Tax=Solea solea TaxID=90069 RepID=UPI00272B20C1|nr:tetraspanin-7 isoform X1 [Solea solea]
MSSRRLQTKPMITCIKTFLVSYSLIFWLTGVILLGVGVWGKVNLEAYFSLASEECTNAPYVLIGTGAFIIVFGLFGCFATCRGSPWMLKLYAMFLILVFLSELVAGISGFIFRHEMRNILGLTYQNAVRSYNRDNDSVSSEAIHRVLQNQLGHTYENAVRLYNKIDSSSSAVDAIQRSLHCCGVNNYTDWSETTYFATHGIPASCCRSDAVCTENNLRVLATAADLVYSQGCFTVMTQTVEANLGIIAGISFGISCFQIIGIFLACFLSRYISKNQYEMV